ncbi:MAG: protein translocase subunit SecDF [Bacteroidales bacterium]|nr:protein translocase subunit SecDF [Bacteroidales bacterium]
MRNKGAILTLAIALTLVCLYQLSFTWVAVGIRKDAGEFAKGNQEKEEKYLDSILNEDVYNILINEFTFREVQEREINFGLDLKGGMNVILEISTVDVIRSLANYSTDSTFNSAIALAKKKQKETSNKDFIALFGESFNEIDPDARLAAIFTTQELRDRINYDTPNEEVLKVIRDEAEGAIDNAFNIIRTRIDQFGVTQPQIQQLETKDRILVDLPGVKNRERVRKLLQGTANLEFWETYENAELIRNLYTADEVVREYLETQKELKKEEAEESVSAIEAVPKEDATEKEPVSELLSEDLAEEEDDGEQTLLEQIQSDTVTSDSLTPAGIENAYPLLSILNPMQDPQNRQPYPGAVLGTAHFKDTTKINFYLKIAKEKNIFPREARFYWSALPIMDENNRPTDRFRLYAIKVKSRDGQPPLDGDVIVSARIDYDPATGEPMVLMGMDSEGTTKWAHITKENIGKVICVVMDQRVYSGPVVNQEITGGNSQITGSFTVAEAQDLANLLKSGKLPAPATIIQENVVGPSLGHKAINDGFKSFIIAFIIVLFYMIFYYSRRAGLVADIALVANMFFIAGVLASLTASLTLPGIAGIVLTIGMSVDANVLIYERIREELEAGKGVRMAISDGYKNAYSAIIDANLTTLITAIILFLFGTGPIKGFATTLWIGICTSLFSAIFVTRLIFESFLKRNKEITFSTVLTRNAFKKVNINFIDKRKIAYIISIAVVVVGIGSLIVRGLDPGVDFTGGRNYIIKFKEPVPTYDITDALTEKFGQTPKVIIFGEEEQVRITTRYKIDEEGSEVDDEIQRLIFEAVQPLINEDIDYNTFYDQYWQSNQKVGPTIADDIKRQAGFAIFLALVFMFLYILLRFRNWQYGLGAVAALIHDVLIVLGVFSLLYGLMPFSLEIDQSFVAAILTVVGYSINDTVVIFDRIREYIHLYPKRDRKEIMNMALNSTLSRTFSTSFSTFIVLLAIFVFGGEVIRGFVFALLIGVVVGTYSSLFVATPVVFDSTKKSEEKVNKGLKRK